MRLDRRLRPDHRVGAATARCSWRSRRPRWRCYPERPTGSPRNTWPAEVAAVTRHGDSLRIELTGPITAAADVTPAAAVDLGLVTGSRVWATLKATEARSYLAMTGI